MFLIVTLDENMVTRWPADRLEETANQIVLWPLGGVAYVDPPPRPGATLWSIAAGPLGNLALRHILAPEGKQIGTMTRLGFDSWAASLLPLWGNWAAYPSLDACSRRFPADVKRDSGNQHDHSRECPKLPAAPVRGTCSAARFRNAYRRAHLRGASP